MALYRYTKIKNTKQKKILTYLSYASMLIGCLFLFWSFYPVITFEIYSELFIKRQVNNPIASDKTVFMKTMTKLLGQDKSLPNNMTDYTKASYWFPAIEETINATYNPVTEEEDNDNLIGRRLSEIKKYHLSIPKLNIDDAVVNIGGNDLLAGLVHYYPKSLPGEYGNIAIFGHSSLPALYRKEDYRYIFTYLPTLEEGDKIYLKVDDLTYEYQAYDKFIINPDQVSVLEQKYDNAYLTLITCVPLGTYWKRLVVQAKLTQLPSDF